MFFLRDDVARSKQADFYRGILAKINTREWSHRKDFKRKKRRLGRKQYTVREQYLLQPDECHFQKLAFTDAEQAQFHVEWRYQKGGGKFIKRYVFNEPWRFVLRVRPSIIDKVRKQDPELDTRLDEIDSYLKYNAYRQTQSRLLHGAYQYHWKKYEKHNEVNPFKNKPLQKILDELKEVNT